MLKIEVTQEDIEKGHMSNARCCPVALATERAISKNQNKVRVYVSPKAVEVYFHKFTGSVIFNTSTRMEKWIKRFDRCGKEAVKPVKFIVTEKSLML